MGAVSFERDGKTEARMQTMENGNGIIDVKSWAAGEAGGADGETGAGSASAAYGATSTKRDKGAGNGHGAKTVPGAMHFPMWKRVGAGVLAAVLVGGCVPLTAFAAQYQASQSSTVASSSSDSGASTQQGSGQDGSQNGQPPAMPGSNASGSSDGQAQGQGGTPPEKPDGDTSGPQDGQTQGENGQPPAMPDGSSQQGGDGQQGGGPGGQMPGGGGANTQSFDYAGSYSGVLTADGEEKSSTGESIESTTADQNAALAQNGGSLSISGDTITKSGDSTSSQDNVNFYGTNAGILAVGEGSAAYVDGTSLTTDAAGSNGIFSTDNATVYVNDTDITTKSAQGNSRGLDATYGGTIVGNKLSISTAGGHSASIATDRGGGSISVSDSTLATAGSGSPLLYSTGDIEVDGVSGTASGSQIAGMEGKNSIYIEDSQLSSTNNAISGSDPVKNGVIIYQSTSGDADTSTGDAARFEALRSTLSTTIDSGSMFYFTNTSANVVVSESTLDFDSSKVNLIQAEGNDANSWGSAGSNGATVNFTLKKQDAAGNATADDISTATIYLLDGSTWSGAASITENSAANKTTSDAPLTINVGSDSTWTVTGDSTVTNLNVQAGGKVVDENGKSVTIVAGGTTVVQGESSVTVTVTGSYGTDFETGDANEIQGASIERAAFDTRYGTSTEFSVISQVDASSASGSSQSSGSAGAQEGSESGQQNFFEWVREFVERLFGGGQDSSQQQTSQGSQGSQDASQSGNAPQQGQQPPQAPGQQGAGGQGGQQPGQSGQQQQGQGQSQEQGQGQNQEQGQGQSQQQTGGQSTQAQTQA